MGIAGESGWLFNELLGFASGTAQGCVARRLIPATYKEL